MFQHLKHNIKYTCILNTEKIYSYHKDERYGYHIAPWYSWNQTSSQDTILTSVTGAFFASYCEKQCVPNTCDESRFTWMKCKYLCEILLKLALNTVHSDSSHSDCTNIMFVCRQIKKKHIQQTSNCNLN